MKKILVHSEASYLNSGYGKITKNLCHRFHELGYEVAEFANYGHVDFPAKKNIPWTYYGSLPGNFWNQPPSEQENNTYNSDPLNQFGKWRAGDVLLHFRPDVVVSYMDNWMSSYLNNHPLRHNFNLIWAPTVDAQSQSEQWIADYISCDAVFTYTDFAHKTLEKESGGLIPLKGIAPPGVDTKIFVPIHNKKEHKAKYGLSDYKILGTVMRNQRRKLFPDLFKAFRQYLNKYNDKVLLYCHTSYPDLGWDLARLLKEEGLSHKVLFSYICHQCGAAYPSFFQDAVMICPSCNQASARMPNTQIGLDDSALASIYNLFDLYVQYANCEGAGMPIFEAGACGVHPLYVNYSGMEDSAKLKGTSINYKQLYRESETHCFRAVPDNDDFVEKLHNLVNLPEQVLYKMGMDARRGVLKHFNWDNTVKTLIAQIDKMEGKWGQPPRIHQPNMNEPALNDRDYVYWCINNILGEPEKVNSYLATIILKDLSTGFCSNYGDTHITEDSVLGSRNRLMPFTRKEVKERLLKICEERNLWEARKANLDKSYKTPDWLLKSIEK